MRKSLASVALVGALAACGGEDASFGGSGSGDGGSDAGASSGGAGGSRGGQGGRSSGGTSEAGGSATGGSGDASVGMGGADAGDAGDGGDRDASEGDAEGPEAGPGGSDGGSEASAGGAGNGGTASGTGGTGTGGTASGGAGNGGAGTGGTPSGGAGNGGSGTGGAGTGGTASGGAAGSGGAASCTGNPDPTATVECGSNAECCASGRICGQFVVGTPTRAQCRAPIPAGGSLGATCTGGFTGNAQCRTGLCPTALGYCSAICEVDADCGDADLLCRPYSVNGTPFGICAESCTGDASCGAGQICLIRSSSAAMDRIDRYCVTAPATGSPPGTTTTNPSTCDHGQTLIVGVEQFCTAPCDTGADCPAAVPSCLYVNFTTPGSSTIASMGLCSR